MEKRGTARFPGRGKTWERRLDSDVKVKDTRSFRFQTTLEQGRKGETLERHCLSRSFERLGHCLLGVVAPAQNEIPNRADQRRYSEANGRHFRGADAAMRWVPDGPPALSACKIRRTKNCQGSQQK